MTTKRDLKRRIRARQARTGESYVTARRHVLAARITDEDPPTDDAGETEPIDVAEVIDLSPSASALGFACDVLVYPTLADAVDLAHALDAVRAALSVDEATTQLLRDLALRGKVPRQPRITRDARFLERARAGMTTVSADGRVLAVQVPGRDGRVTVLAAAWRGVRALLLVRLDDPSSRLVAPPTRADQLVSTSEARVFLIFEGRRYEIGTEPFVIGRHRSSQLRDGHVSRKHAAIVWRRGAHYLIDLGSQRGIEYRGLSIDNKRIEEGDAFRIADYTVRFTFFETDG